MELAIELIVPAMRGRTVIPIWLAGAFVAKQGGSHERAYLYTS
jgi:hypothetical protein